MLVYLKYTGSYSGITIKVNGNDVYLPKNVDRHFNVVESDMEYIISLSRVGVRSRVNEPVQIVQPVVTYTSEPPKVSRPDLATIQNNEVVIPKVDSSITYTEVDLEPEKKVSLDDITSRLMAAIGEVPTTGLGEEVVDKMDLPQPASVDDEPQINAKDLKRMMRDNITKIRAKADELGIPWTEEDSKREICIKILSK